MGQCTSLRQFLDCKWLFDGTNRFLDQLKRVFCQPFFQFDPRTFLVSLQQQIDLLLSDPWMFEAFPSLLKYLDTLGKSL